MIRKKRVSVHSRKKDAYQISILAQRLFFPDKNLTHTFLFYDPETRISLNGKMRIITLELEKSSMYVDKPVREMSGEEEWAVYFQYLTNEAKREKIYFLTVPKEKIMAEKNESLLANCTSGGCGAKIGPGELSALLGKFSGARDERLLVGFDCSDDAAVYALDDNKAIVSTVDFFSPMIDDPFVFGQIAAANALSDIYAMGASPFLALNLVCFPEKLPKTILADILAGGAEKIAETGAVLGGGHSIYDKETKYGLAVTGLVERRNVIRNNTPHVGYSLILTKPLGVGIVMAAERVGAANAESMQKAVNSMRRLNRYAAEKMFRFNISACTDVTGFGLLCHLLEMCGDTVSAEIWPEELPIIKEAADYANDFLLTAAAQRNRNHFGKQGQVEKLPFATQELMFDPQTSGGLLICVDNEQSRQLLDSIQKDDPDARIIGRIIEREDDIILFGGEK